MNCSVGDVVMVVDQVSLSTCAVLITGTDFNSHDFVGSTASGQSIAFNHSSIISRMSSTLVNPVGLEQQIPEAYKQKIRDLIDEV